MPPGKQEQVAPPGFDGYGQHPPPQGQYPPQGQFASGYPPQQPYPPQQASYGQPAYGQPAYGQPAYGQPFAAGQQWAAPAATNGGQQRPSNNSNNTIGSGSYVVNVDPDMAVAQQFATTQVRNGFVRKVSSTKQELLEACRAAAACGIHAAAGCGC